MNKDIENYIRSEIKSNLEKCTDDQVMLFKRMYCHKNLDANIDEAVNSVPSEGLDWAYTQVTNTLKKDD